VSGFVRIKYKESISDPLAWNTSAANLAIAFNGLRDAVRDDVTVTVNAALSAGTTTTWTFSSQFRSSQCDSQNLVQIIDNSMETVAPAQISAITTRTTVGNGGWSTGSYTLTLYSYRFKEVIRTGDKVTISQ